MARTSKDAKLIKRLMAERKVLMKRAVSQRKLLEERNKLIRLKKELRVLNLQTGRDIISRLKRAKVSPEKRRKARIVISKIGKFISRINTDIEF